MEGIVFVISILALLHSVTSCTQNEPYTCYKQETSPDVTVSWCWKFWYLFRCKEEHSNTKTVSSTCHRTVCCEGYQRLNSLDECKAVCFGSNSCQNGGSCVAPNKCICRSGYVSPKCDDENECSIKNGGCSHTCLNTKGSYHCFCPPGFTLDSNQLTCKAIATTQQSTTPDVCSTDNGGCSHFCVKVNETVRCNCPAQMNLADDNVTCISDRSTPIDEVVHHYRGMGILLCLGIAGFLLFSVITSAMLIKKWYGWRWSASCGYWKLPTEEQKVCLIAKEYCNEVDGNDWQKPPPYQEKMDDLDLYI